MNIAHFIRKMLPQFVHPLFRKVYRRGLGYWYWGNRVICPCCHGRFRSFRSFGHPRRPNALCPGCGALERQRLLMLFLKNQTNFFQEKLRVLHVAPPSFFFRTLLTLPHHYVPVDLHSPLAKIRLDVMHLPFYEHEFDVVLCNHVLEHVLDDQLAMREILRVLKPNGWAILQVPVDHQLKKTYEVDAPTLLTDQQRVELFGQEDHVRQYGQDYSNRLEHAGFSVCVEPYGQILGTSVAKTYGLMFDEPIFFCKKSVPL